MKFIKQRLSLHLMLVFQNSHHLPINVRW